LGQHQQARYTRANRRLQLPRPDEQPGNMPEIAPSPDYGRSINRPFNERAQVLQAWGTYGTIWPVVHQQLGVRPDLGRGRLEVVPQMPPGAPEMKGKNIRLGGGALNVSASEGGGAYRTHILASLDARVRLGHTLPYNGRAIASVSLNGNPVDFDVRRTNRGREVTVRAASRSRQRLVVRTA
jgi:hypothetical protein